MEKNSKAPKEKTEMWNFYELLVASQLPLPEQTVEKTLSGPPREKICAP